MAGSWAGRAIFVHPDNALGGGSPAKQQQVKAAHGSRTSPPSPSGRLSSSPKSPLSTYDLNVGSPYAGSRSGTKAQVRFTSRRGRYAQQMCCARQVRNKKPAVSPEGTKHGPVSSPSANTLAVKAHPGIQSPTAKPKKKQRARIEQEEMVVVEVTREQFSHDRNQSPDVNVVGSPTSAASNVASPASVSPDRHLGVDIRRPSILKVRGAFKSKALATPSVARGGASSLPEDFLRRPSTVDFGPPECRMLPDVQDDSDEMALHEGESWASPTPESLERHYSPRFQSPTTSGMPSNAATPRSQMGAESSLLSRPPEASSIGVSSPAAAASGVAHDRRRFSIASPTAHRVSSPGTPVTPRRLLAEAATPSPSSDEKDGSRQRRAHESMRTAFVLCSSLVTVTGSLCSTITIAAKEALLTHDIVKPGPQGLLRWLILNTPTALLSTICCCVPLYYLHLKSRDVVQSARELRDVQVAATARLEKLGPIRKTDFLLVYGIISYLVFMIMESIFRYNTRGNLVVFVSFLLLLFSAVPRSIRQLWSPQQRVFCWSTVAREMPWPVVIVQSAVQLISRVVERNNLLEAGFATVGPEFWAANSRLTNQMLFGVVGSVLAEMDENESLGLLLMPLVLDIARDTRVAPGAYAVPVALGASSNMILPIRLPLIVAHEIIDVPMTQLILIGILVKVVMLITSIVSVNTFGEYLISLEPPEVNATLSGNDTALEFDA
ncbi:uncharacterized protein LOC144119788 [Amblyomma americanum]